jgi:hypothetical protein
MAIPILNHLDLRSVSELQNAILHTTTTGSASNVEGKIIYDTGTNTVQYYNGSAWISLTGLDANTWRPVTAGGNTLSTSETLAFTAGTNITITESAGAVTINSAVGTEDVQDIVAGQLVTNGSHSGISFVYDDAGDGAIDATIATLNQNTTGSAATLTTARTIGGVSFNGSANIDLPGVNTAGNQNTSGLAATATLAASATVLATARAIGGVSFDGSAAINLPGVNAAGNQNTSGTAANLSGTPNVSVGTIASGNITTTGYLRGPATFTIDPATHADNTGTVVIAGNLQVDGSTTTINSTTVAIDDLNFSIATDAADSAAANGAGITIGGASATLIYTHATTSWDMNKPLNVTGNIGVTGTVDGIDIATDVAANTAKVTNVSTNLGITGTSAARVITSSDGTNATIPVATTSVSGVMSAAQVTTLNAAQTAAEVTAEVGTLIDARSSAHTITGDASATEFTITYGFTAAAVNDVIIQVVCSYASDTDYDGDTVYAETERHSTTQCKIKFATAPASGHTYRVLCFKVA